MITHGHLCYIHEKIVTGREVSNTQRKMTTRALVTTTILAVVSIHGTVNAQQNIPLGVYTLKYLYKIIYFDPSRFTEFFKCVCEGTATDCTANYGIENSNLVVQTLSQSGIFNGNQGAPRYYQCELVTYENRFTCTQISQTDSVCSTSPYFQSARFNITASCDKSCFTLFWTYERRDLPGGWFNECEAGKGCQAVTTSTTISTATTTQKPSTASVSLPASTPPLSPPASTPPLSPLTPTTSLLKSLLSPSSQAVPRSDVSPASSQSSVITSTRSPITSPPFSPVNILINIAIKISLPNSL